MTDITDAGVLTLLEHIVASLVDDTEAASVTMKRNETGAVSLVSVIAKDVGKVAGRSGRTARALRSVLSAVAAASGRRFQLEIERSSSEKDAG